ncbi:hypothetical protein NE237_007777 [Protea cynaroides]|uniref:DUF295 domain-containing protein n=1 Tax=Protea cynaroides TaxID=273540 RepID=A0A9Q0KPU7_9MAGN|nr:hypothetical protein NE237_007777 [Protea cynaroides]
MAAAAQHRNKMWSELPEELIVMISDRISLYADYVRFSSVCFSWHSTLARNLCPSQQRQYFPFLLLPCEDDEENNSDTCNHYLLSLPENNNIYHLRSLPKQSMSLYCPGSSHGWLVMVDQSTSSMNLVNPFTRVQLPLPSMNKFRRLLKNQPYRFGKVYTKRLLSEEINMLGVKKVVLSSSPSSSSLMSSSQFQSSDVVAVAIFNGLEALAFSRPGDKAWCRLTTASDYFVDVLFYRNHLYNIVRKKRCNRCRILVFRMDVDIDGGGPFLKLVDSIQIPESQHLLRWRPYMVESCGDLLLVARESAVKPAPYFNPFEGKAIGFRVFKFCRGNSDDNRSSTWVEIKNLGDRMLFLGVNSSLSLSSHDFPGCRGNSIYFTSQECRTNHLYGTQGGGYDMNIYDMGVFNLEDKRIEPFPLQGCTSSRGPHLLQKFCAPPIWLFPNPN